MAKASLFLVLLASSYARAGWTMPQTGLASLTHYELGPDAVAGKKGIIQTFSLHILTIQISLWLRRSIFEISYGSLEHDGIWKFPGIWSWLW